MIQLVSTRFNNTTWRQNAEYRKRYNCCIYGSPQTVTSAIDLDALVFVVEMNNDENQIEGVGLIRNRPLLNKYYKVYSDGNYNRYVYKTDYHVDKYTISRYNPMLVETLNYILFKGKTHSKRGSGFTQISPKLLKQETFINELRDVFIKVFKN